MSGEKLKIAVFHCGFVYSGGGERLVLEEVAGLRRRGHRVVCFAPTLDRELCYPDFIDQVGVRTFLPQLPKWFPLRDALSMVLSSVLAPLLAVRFRDIDVFVGANQPAAWIAFCMAKVLRKPYVVYLNQPNRLIYPRPIDQETGWQTKRDYHFLNLIIQRIKPFVAWADRVSFTGAHTMLANGTYIAGVIEGIYGRKPVLCPAACHPRPRHLLQLNPQSPYRGSFTVKDFTIRKPYVLITNRHDPQKMLDYVIEAMAQVVEQFPEASLLVTGSFTGHTANLLALATRLGLQDKVLFLGHVLEQDLQRLYQEAAVYCYPAPEEDFGMGVIESMAWGVPVVAWNHAGPTVTVQHGQTGYLAEPYSVKDYARGITRLFKDPLARVTLGIRARDRVEREFSWERHVAILEHAILDAYPLWVGAPAPAPQPTLASQEGYGPLPSPNPNSKKGMPVEAILAELESEPPA